MRRVAYRPRRKLLCAAKRADPGAREKLAEAVMPRTAPVQWLYRATPTVQRQESSQQVVVGLLEAPRELARADRPPRSLQQPVHTGEVELVARLGARRGRDGGEHTLAAGFCVARLALGDGPADRLVVHDVVARPASPSADLLCFARGHDGVAVIGPNHGWSWSFVVDDVCGPCYLEVPASTPAGRSPELLAAAVVRIATRQPHALRGPVPRAEVAPLPRRAVAYVDGDGNLATTMPQPPAALGSRLRIRIGLVSAPARVAAAGEWLPDGELVLRPASSGWPLRGGGRRRLVELHLPGGSAAARFDDPPIGAPIAVESRRRRG